MSNRSTLADVSAAYGHFSLRRDQALHRGAHDRADDAIDVLKEIERCVQVKEVSTSWRTTIADIQKREGRS